jgi:hypothetical protein
MYHHHEAFYSIVSIMSYPHHSFLPSAFHIDPMYPSFTVDRTTTVHTIFTMIQLDGTCKSKVADTATIPHAISPPRRKTTKLSRKDTQARPSTRKRFAHLFTSKKRTSTSLSNLTIEDAGDTHHDRQMRILSPRVTDLEPPTPEGKAKRRSFTMKRRQTNRKSEPIIADSSTAAANVQLTLCEALNDGGLIPVTDAPCLLPMRGECVPGLPMRRDSVAMGSAGMPGSPMKEAALTSHPIIRIETAESESSSEFKTPVGRRSVESGNT